MSRLFEIFNLNGKQNFYMRDFRNAYRFRPDINPVRQKFQGYVNFVFNRDLYRSLYGAPETTEFRTTISSLVKTADLPGVSFKTETLNAYNKKRIVNTGVDYQPVNMTVYDTVNNEWLTTVMKYFSYHYMNPRNEQQLDEIGTSRDMQPVNSSGRVYNRSGASASSVSGSNFAKRDNTSSFDSNSDGYNINNTAHFFERIDYILYHGQRAVQYSLMNPVLTEFKPGGIDYSDSNAMEFNLSFQYEKFTIFNVTNFDMSADDLDRFENAKGLEGPAFIATPDEVKPISRNLSILGNAGSLDRNRNRTQQVGPAQQASADSIEETPPAPIRTYGTPYTYSGDSGITSREEIISNTIGRIFDNSITAAINGGSVRDAALGTAIGGLGRIINYNAEQARRNPPTNDATGSVTEETSTTPPPSE
jgi:hypothetical protein